MQLWETTSDTCSQQEDDMSYRKRVYYFQEKHVTEYEDEEFSITFQISYTTCSFSSYFFPLDHSLKDGNFFLDLNLFQKLLRDQIN